MIEEVEFYRKIDHTKDNSIKLEHFAKELLIWQLPNFKAIPSKTLEFMSSLMLSNTTIDSSAIVL